MNAYFIGQFRSGALRCFAFESPRTFHSDPVEILPGHWTIYPDWKKGEFKANGLHLIELRVMRRKAPSNRITAPKPASPGRPSVQADVKAAFQGLKELGRIDPDCSAKHHYPMVRQWIGENIQNPVVAADKLSDEGIRAHFSHLFNELQKTVNRY